MEEKRKRGMTPRWLKNQLLDNMKVELGKRAIDQDRAIELMLIKLLGKKKRSQAWKPQPYQTIL